MALQIAFRPLSFKIRAATSCCRQSRSAMRRWHAYSHAARKFSSMWRIAPKSARRGLVMWQSPVASASRKSRWWHCLRSKFACASQLLSASLPALHLGDHRRTDVATGFVWIEQCLKHPAVGNGIIVTMALRRACSACRSLLGACSRSCFCRALQPGGI